MLKSLFVPDAIYEVVEDIGIEGLYQKGYRDILLDLDNTILPYGQRQLSLQKINWLEKVKSLGYRVFLVSNNSSKRRVQRIADQLQLEGLYFAQKPLPFSARELAVRHAIDFNKTLVIGDQLLTDVVLGNWLGARSILVDPIHRGSSYIKHLQYKVEGFFLKQLER